MSRFTAFVVFLGVVLGASIVSVEAAVALTCQQRQLLVSAALSRGDIAGAELASRMPCSSGQSSSTTLTCTQKNRNIASALSRGDIADAAYWEAARCAGSSGGSSSDSGNIVPAPQQAAPVVTPPVITTPTPDLAPVITTPTPVLAPETSEATTQVTEEPRFWATRTGNTAKVYAKNIIGMGKIQFMVNGREIGWVMAVDATNPKLRVTAGTHYFVRSHALATGKNAIEIYVDGERQKRVAYTR